jgi:hypothetical protein
MMIHLLPDRGHQTGAAPGELAQKRVEPGAREAHGAHLLGAVAAAGGDDGRGAHMAGAGPQCADAEKVARVQRVDKD